MAKQELFPSKPPARDSKASAYGRAMLPYLIMVVVASGAMAWYCFVFVPSQLHYFLGARFRTLAVASGQISGKIENLKKALDGAASSVQLEKKPRDAALSETERTALTTYLEILVPDMQPNREGRPVPSGLCLSTGAHDKYSVTVAWRDIVVQAAAASRPDFADLLLANENGVVVWQREDATPRVADLRELMNAEAPANGWLPVSLSWTVTTTVPTAQKKDLTMSDSAVMKSVNLNGRSSYLLVQAINPGKKFYVAGLVSTAALQQQAMHIPITRVVLFAVPLSLLFLALPFVKLATLTPRERFGFVDVVLLSVAAIMATGIGTILLFVPSFTNSTRDKQLSDFAAKVESRLVRETQDILKLADDLEKKRADNDRSALEACAVDKTKYRCDLWQTFDTATKPGSMELDVVIWVKPDGEQELKWSTKKQVTGNTSHRPFDHYRDLKAGRTWQLRGSSQKFTIDPLRSPTTSDLGFAFALGGDPEVSNLVLNVRPQSVVDPIVPPGYGFAIVAPSGKVLFHSKEGLSLEENFLEEVGDGEEVRAMAQIDREFTWSGDYHGRMHRLHMRPVERFVGCPWRIVTFEELEPRYAAEFRRQSGVFRLGSINMLVLAATALLFCLRARKRNTDIRYTVMSMFALPLERTKAARDRAIRSLTKLAAVGVLIFLLTYTSLGRHWNWFYPAFALLPVAAITFSVRARMFGGDQIQKRKAAKEDQKAAPERRLALELGLLVLLIGVIPTAGFARIVHRFERFQETELWLLDVQQQWLARASRTLERAVGPGYSTTTRDLLRKEPGFAASWSSGTPAYSYLNLVQGFAMDKSDRESPETLPDPLHFLLRLFEPKDHSSNRSEFSTQGDVLQLKPSAELVIPVFKAEYTGKPGEDLSPAKAGSGLAILGGVLFAVLWASRKLSIPPASGAPSLDDLVSAIDVNEAILVIGPPRNRKDTTVRDTVRKHVNPQTEDVPVRIPLLDMTLSDSTIKDLVTQCEQLPITGRESAADSSGRVWVHLSNLESQLTTVESRAQVLKLLERLMDQTSDKTPHVLVVTSSVDPIANFREIFEQERKTIYEDSIPEFELSQSAMVLSRFRRCYLPIEPRKTPGEEMEKVRSAWRNYNPHKWRQTAEAEIEGCKPLAHILSELDIMWSAKKSIDRETLASTIQSKARAYYELLWTSCTRTEKLVLVQLAQEGFANPKSRDIVAQLIAKGLVTEQPKPAVFNYTFREFLRGSERNNVVHEWERMEGSGIWVVSGRLVAAGLVLGGVFYLLTQDFSVQSLLPIVSGTGVFGIPIVRDLVARFTGKSAAVASA